MIVFFVNKLYYFLCENTNNNIIFISLRIIKEIYVR